jgi:hypothetical protein
MTSLVIVALFGVLLVLFGAVLGAEFQDRVHEGQRRRMAHRQREVNARWRAMQGRGAAVELTWPSRQLVIPIAFEAEDAA